MLWEIFFFENNSIAHYNQKEQAHGISRAFSSRQTQKPGALKVSPPFLLSYSWWVFTMPP